MAPAVDEGTTYRLLCKVLTASDFFSGFNQQETSALTKIVKVKVLNKNENFVKQGDMPNSVAVVAKGALEVRINFRLVHKLRLGELVGELGLLIGEKSFAEVRACPSGATVLAIKYSDFSTVNLQNPFLGLKLYQMCARAGVVKLQRMITDANGPEAFIINRSSILNQNFPRHLWKAMAVNSYLVCKFDEDAINNIAMFMSPVTFLKSEIILQRDKLASSMLLILKGTVELRVEGLDSQLLTTYTVGDTIGEYGFIQAFVNDGYSHLRMCDVIACEEVTCAAMSVEQLFALHESNPFVAWYFFRGVAAQALARLCQQVKMKREAEAARNPSCMEDEEEKKKVLKPTFMARSNASLPSMGLEVMNERAEADEEGADEEMDKMDIQALLSHFSVFSPYWRFFEHNELTDLLKRMAVINLCQGDVLMRPGEQANYFGYVISGGLKVNNHIPGQKTKYYAKGSFIGHVGFFLGGLRDEEVVAISDDTSLTLFDYQRVFSLNANAPALSLKLMRMLSYAALCGLKHDLAGPSELATLQARRKEAIEEAMSRHEMPDPDACRNALMECSGVVGEMLSGWTVRQVKELAGVMQLANLQQGEALYHRGARATCVFILLRGGVQWNIDTPDSPVITKSKASGCFLGEVSLLESEFHESQIRSCSCYVSSPTALVAATTFQSLLTINATVPPFAKDMFCKTLRAHILRLVQAGNRALQLSDKLNHEKLMVEARSSLMKDKIEKDRENEQKEREKNSLLSKSSTSKLKSAISKVKTIKDLSASSFGQRRFSDQSSASAGSPRSATNSPRKFATTSSSPKPSKPHRLSGGGSDAGLPHLQSSQELVSVKSNLSLPTSNSAQELSQLSAQETQESLPSLPCSSPRRKESMGSEAVLSRKVSYQEDSRKSTPSLSRKPSSTVGSTSPRKGSKSDVSPGKKKRGKRKSKKQPEKRVPTQAELEAEERDDIRKAYRVSHHLGDDKDIEMEDIMLQTTKHLERNRQSLHIAAFAESDAPLEIPADCMPTAPAVEENCQLEVSLPDSDEDFDEFDVQSLDKKDNHMHLPEMKPWGRFTLSRPAIESRKKKAGLLGIVPVSQTSNQRYGSMDDYIPFDWDRTNPPSPSRLSPDELSPIFPRSPDFKHRHERIEMEISNKSPMFENPDINLGGLTKHANHRYRSPSPTMDFQKATARSFSPSDYLYDKPRIFDPPEQGRKNRFAKTLDPAYKARTEFILKRSTTPDERMLPVLFKMRNRSPNRFDKFIIPQGIVSSVDSSRSASATPMPRAASRLVESADDRAIRPHSSMDGMLTHIRKASLV